MATRRRMLHYGYFNSNHKVDDGLFSLSTTIVDGAPQLSVIKLHSRSSEGIQYNKDLITVHDLEQLPLTKELFDIIISQHSDEYVATIMDPFVRWKFRDSIVYKLLYYGEATGPNNSGSLSARILWALYNTDVDVLEYLIYLFGGQDIKIDTFISVCNRIDTVKNGKSPRKRLGFSKNKARVIKTCKYPDLMRFPNYVFDDDVDFLLEFFSMRQTYALLEILRIKEINPKLKYEDIIRKAVVFTIDSQNEYITFNSVMDTFVELLKCYKSLKETGFDKPFRLCKNHFFYEDYNADENRSINFTVENAKVYKLNTTNQLAYANAISEAYSKDGLAQALSRGNEFCLIVKRGKYYIAEVYDGYVININGKNDATGLHVMY